MVTRRCSERRFFMRPDAETNNAFVYCLAVAAKKAAVGVVFFTAMSNHYHAGVVDSEGRLPEFLEHFHKLFAKHQNALRGRWENFWASEQTSVVELVSSEDIVEKMAYTLGNPVKDHLVQCAHQWPGASSLGAQVHGHRISAHRPRHLFRPDGPMPPAVELKLVTPVELESLAREELLAVLRERLTSIEQQALGARARGEAQLLGRRGVLDQNWSDRPRRPEPRRQLSPRVACKNIWRRIEVLRRNKIFVAQYRCAREAFLGGGAAVFPEGTYWLTRFAGARCGPPT
jgi:hypothetical protein